MKKVMLELNLRSSIDEKSGGHSRLRKYFKGSEEKLELAGKEIVEVEI